MLSWDVVILIICLSALLWIYIKRSTTFFIKNGVKTSSVYPFVGSMWNVVQRRENFNETIKNAYLSFPNHKYIGFYQFHKPVYIIKDINIIRQIAIKDFDSFQDHQPVVDESADPLLGKNLFFLSGKKWRDMRSTLSPAFTGSKMRNMFLLVSEISEQMTNYYLNKINDYENKDKAVMDIEMKDAFTRYTNDVIASAAFGVKIDSLKHQNNEFYLMGKKATTFTILRLVKMLLSTTAPKFTKALGITLLGDKLSNFFRNLITNQIKLREENNVIRQDMIHLLMEARKGVLKHEATTEKIDAGFATVEESSLGKQTVKKELSDDDIIAQVILFFIAGFDTSSTALSFLIYELAINPNIQIRLHREIDEVYKSNNGKLRYDDLLSMKYLDMVISETLRKWPPGSITDRQCVKPYILPPASPDSKTVKLNVGDGLWIPVYAIHNDPEHYKDPDVFDPERFSDENKSNIKSFTYIPFGIGPRNCIGSRFALMEIKSIAFYLLSKFEFVVTKKTPQSAILNKKNFNLQLEGGFWVGLKIRRPKT